MPDGYPPLPPKRQTGLRERWDAGMQSAICRSVPLNPLSPVVCLGMVIVVVVFLCVAEECGQAARGAQDEVHLGGLADVIICTAGGVWAVRLSSTST